MNKYRFTVYGLVDPFSGLIRYVGVTRQHLMTRLEGHLNSLKNDDSDKAEWLKSLLTLNERPIPIVLSTTEDETEAFNRESHFIRHGKMHGWPLTNIIANERTAPVYDDKDTQILGLIEQGKGVTEIVKEVYGVKGGRKFAEYSNTVMEVIRRNLN